MLPQHACECLRRTERWFVPERRCMLPGPQAATASGFRSSGAASTRGVAWSTNRRWTATTRSSTVWTGELRSCALPDAIPIC